jgi:hypothetical protein
MGLFSVPDMCNQFTGDTQTDKHFRDGIENKGCVLSVGCEALDFEQFWDKIKGGQFWVLQKTYTKSVLPSKKGQVS